MDGWRCCSGRHIVTVLPESIWNWKSNGDGGSAG
jgi:hypothetical protein